MPAAIPIKECPGCTDRALRAALPVENRCKACRKKERYRLWCLANPDANAANAKRWRAEGNKAARPAGYAETQRVRARERYRQDPEVRERAKATARKQREANPEATRMAHKAWVDANRDKVRKYNRERARVFHATSEGKESLRRAREKFRTERAAANAAYNARRYGAHGKLEPQFLNWLHKWQDHCCAYCNAPLEGKETIEHVVPLNCGGTNLPHNAVLACSSCNASKKDRLLDGWIPSRGIQPRPRIHAVEMTRQAARMLGEAGVAVEIAPDHMVLPTGRKLFVLSSFWLAERLDTPQVTLPVLVQTHPDAVFTFDYEWKTRPTALLNSALAKAGAFASIGARETTVCAPTTDEVRAFMNQWHIQGFAAGSVYVGLKDAAGTWRGMLSAYRQRDGAYNICRVAFRGHVVGGLSRLVKALVARSEAAPGTRFLTYGDTRLGLGGGYIQTGFVEVGESVASYHVANAVGLHHWNNCAKYKLAKSADFYEHSWVHWRLLRANGLWRVTDVPLRRFILTV
jgi:5-methylcytosine-specific restriction endonuclease McrA